MTTEYDPTQYLSSEQRTALLQGWSKDYPHLFQLEEIGRSVEDRPIWACTITNNATGSHHDKPAVYLDASIHGTELCTTAVVLFLVSSLLADYGVDDRVTQALDTTTFYVLPCVNPDAADYVLRHGVLHQGNMRHPGHPDREHFLAGDLDGDGRVLSMRIVDRLGEFKASSADPRLLTPREPGDVDGPFYRVIPEGSYCRPGSDEVAEGTRHGALPHEDDAHGAVRGSNQNTDFPWSWPPVGRDQTDRDRPFMEPENVAVADFVLSRPNIGMAYNYHGSGGVLLFGGKKDTLDAADQQGYDRIGKLALRDLGVPSMHMGPVAFVSWVWYALGIWSMTPEIWAYNQHGLPAGGAPPTMASLTPSESLDAGLLAWSDRELDGSGFVDWYPFEHPQLGTVELGGWNSVETCWKIPPKYLPAEKEKYLRFTLTSAGLLPRLSVESTHAEFVAPTMVELAFDLTNEGWFGTSLSKGAVAQGKIEPIRLALLDAQLVGQTSNALEVPHLEGLASHRVLTVVSPGVRPVYNRQQIRLVAQVSAGQRSVTARFSSTKAGNLTVEVPLPTDSPAGQDRPADR